MKINVTQQIKKLDGTLMNTGKQVCPMCGKIAGEEEAMTVRLATTRALVAVYVDEQGLTGDKKVERWHLALKIMNEDEPDLGAEEVVLIKELVGKMFGPAVVGQVWPILDPTS